MARLQKRKLGEGIRGNAFMTVISGAKVLFDPRTTAEVMDSRDEKNWKAAEQSFRKARWEERLREKRKEAA